MIEAPFLPRQGVVAGFAARSQLVLVLVVFLMTGDAGYIRVLEGGCQVALLALDLGVFAEQRETGQAVIDFAVFPVTLVVAGLAFLAFLAFMFVVLFMAGDAGRRQLVLEQRAGVTGFALGHGMLAAQGILGVPVVIKFRGLPAFFDVTGFTFVTEFTLVSIAVVIFLMAGDARLLEFFHVQDAGMAGFTLGRDVFATQHVFRVAVMVKGRDGPVLFSVTGLALFTEASLVAFLVVVDLVAHYAGGSELLLIQETGVASGTSRQAMFSAQGVFCVLVVVEGDHLPLPVVVAALALGAELALVFIILPVAGDARRRCALELGISVTVFADDIPVFSG